MKFGKLILSALAVTALLAGCKEKENDQPGTPSVKVSPESVAFTADGGSQEVTVEATRDWTVEKPDWVTVEPASGKAGTLKVKVTAGKNEGIDRSAKVTFNASMVSATLNVAQEGSKDVTYTTLAQVREQATEKTEEGGLLGDNLVVKVLINSDASLKNYALSENMATVQDETAGLKLDFKEGNTYKFGDELVIDLSGAHYEYYSNLLQVAVKEGKTTVKSQGNDVVPVEISVEQLLSGDYESRYVAIKDVQIADADLNKKLASAESRTEITVMDKEGQLFYISHSKTDNKELTEKTVPQGSGILNGVAGVFGSKTQIVFSKATDGDGLTGERFESESEFPWSLGENAYQETANVNEESKTVLKLGKSKEPYSGNATITIPAGTKSFTFYAVSWKNTPSDLTFSNVEGLDPLTVSPAANNGATGNPDYIITVSDSDKYTFTFSSPLESDVKATLTSGKRNLIWDFVFEK